MEEVERRPRSTTCQQCQQPIHSDDSRQRIVVTCAGYAGCSNEACYEWSARLYCRYHFSMLPGTQCAGCDEAILRQFVEHHNYPGKRWHPECYMIQKVSVKMVYLLAINRDILWLKKKPVLECTAISSSEQQQQQQQRGPRYNARWSHKQTL